LGSAHRTGASPAPQKSNKPHHKNLMAGYFLVVALASSADVQLKSVATYAFLAPLMRFWRHLCVFGATYAFLESLESC
ncbi:MAG: hypothetical protein NT013_12160, partial [Planctomycetia bacterium]|nr:hypothetical protein [Planctomycetia bacterium]